MTSIWRSLLWKEWREHRWKLAALVAVVVIVPSILSIRSPGDIYSAITLTLIMGVPLAATFIGMGVAAGEESRGTVRFLQALPTPMARPAAAKLIWAGLTLFLPVLAAMTWSLWWSPMLIGDAAADPQRMVDRMFWKPWGTESWYGAALLGSVLGGGSILIWIAAAGVNRSDEVRAGAVGLLVGLAYWSTISLACVLMRRELDQEPVLGWVAAAPGGPAIVNLPPVANRSLPMWFSRFGLYAGVALAVHGTLVAWYLLRFGRVAPARSQTLEASSARPARTWLAPPRKSPLTAIVWKQFRESAPLAAMAAGGIALAAIGAGIVSDRDTIDVTEFTYILWTVTGVCVAVVAGVGVFMDDLRPGIHTFWRSRPVDVNQWFFVKLAIALVTTLVILSIPPFFTLAAFFWTRDSGANPGMASGMGLVLAAQGGLFVAAVAAMTLVRQAAYAAILALGVAATYGVSVSETLDAWAPGWSEHGWVFGVALAVPVVASTIVAWLAVRKDWGWRS